MAANVVFWLILLVIAAVVIARVVRQSGPNHPGARTSGLEVLEQRYARGEIEREEYLQKKKDLLDRAVS